MKFLNTTTTTRENVHGMSLQRRLAGRHGLTVLFFGAPMQQAQLLEKHALHQFIQMVN